MHLSYCLASFVLAASVAAHIEHFPRSELQRRNALSEKCQPTVQAMNGRRQKRGLLNHSLLAERDTTVEITTESPYYDSLQNDTCILTPEVTEGPYVWNRAQILRQDMTEGQAGVPLYMDIGLINTQTCEPLEDALVSFWHCNATGSYSSFAELSPNTKFQTLLRQLNISKDDFEMGVTDLHTDNSTWLRGIWPTDANGMLEMKTAFPGFYVERATHIHIEVFRNWSLYDNGTLAHDTRMHTGQLFFKEDVLQQIYQLEPYVSHTEVNRTTNAEDTILPDQEAGSYNPYMSVVPLDGEDITKGMVAYITIGIDPTASYNESVPVPM